MKALLTFLLAIFLACSPASAEQPAVGDIFEAAHSTDENAWSWKFRDWTYEGRGEAITGGGRFVVFEKDGSFMIAATEVLTRPKDIGHDGVQRILRTTLAKAAPGEERVLSCDFLTLTPAIAFYNAKTRVARGFFVLANFTHEERWFVNQKTLCYNGD